MKSWKKPTDEMVEKVLTSVKKETDRQYFFSRLQNPLWIPPLVQRGYFKSPPAVRHLPDGYVQYPFWPELQYLKNVCQDAPQEVVDIILNLPHTDNPRVYDVIIEVALKLEGALSARLKPKILDTTQSKYHFLSHRFENLLSYWAEVDQTDGALDVTKALISFLPDSQAKEKQARRKEDPKDWTTSLQPNPRFNQWEFQEILEKGVRPLADKEPYQVARILIDATANMIRLRFHQDELDEGVSDDFSEIWCRRLNKPSGGYHDSEEDLVHTLTYACEQVYEKSPESVVALDEALRNQRWSIFRRLRQHLYSLHTNELTKPWIRELILAHKDYAEWDHQFEFQRMIRRACDNFGADLLTEDERMQIFDEILRGPSKENCREWMGERYSEEGFTKRQRYFQKKQLTPFAAVLFGKYAEYFKELKAERDESITDEDYSPVGEVRGGTVSQRSPKSLEELSQFTDEELLIFINEWQGVHRDENDWLVEINIEALAGAFQSVFKECIIPDDPRLSFWIENRERIERPVYVRAMVHAIQERVKVKDFEKLDQWFDLCEWVLSHPDQAKKDGFTLDDESRENPDWRSSRRAVGDFVGSCLEKDVNAPIFVRERLGALLDKLCTQFDCSLDRDKPVLRNQDDQLTEAINNTRSRALEDLVNFGYWVRRQTQDAQAEVAEVTRILEKRMSPDCEHPLALPEYAILGMHYGRICELNEGWAVQHKSIFFPHDNSRVWVEAFGNFLRFNRPSKPTFEIVRDDIEFALDNLSELKPETEMRRELTDTLGEHLFTYYLWEVYPLRGNESLLEQYYQRTEMDKDRWARLFDYVGRSLRNSGKQLSENLKRRIIEFFDWRFEQKEQTELQEFTFWLEAECLDAEWRLRSFLKILEIGHSNDVGISIQLDALREMLEQHTALVVECFAKVTDSAIRNGAIYIQTDKAKPILKAGLESEDPRVRENAERARENLLRGGRFDFLDTSE